jgi:quercetin dioxygenase-like cupin family protein
LTAALAAPQPMAHNAWTTNIEEVWMDTRTAVLAMIASLALGASLQALAQDANDSPQRREQKRADLAGAPGMEVISSVAEYKPGESVPLHLHHGIESGYVLQGAMIQPPSGAPVMLATGATLMNQRGVVHAGFKVLGDTPLRLFTVHIVDKGKPLYDYAAAPAPKP